MWSGLGKAEERVGERVGERVEERVGERVGDRVGERVGERVAVEATHCSDDFSVSTDEARDCPWRLF